MTASQSSPPPEVVAALAQLDDLVQLFASHPNEAVQEAVVGLLRAVDVLHRGALQRLVAFLEDRLLLDEVLSEPHIALLFELYEAAAGEDGRARADAAVEAIRPYVEAHGGQIEVVAAEGGVINIRLLGACEGCSGSTATLRDLVEEALRAELPEFVRMEVSPPSAQAAPEASAGRVLIPVSSVTRRAPAGPAQGSCGAGGHACSSCG